MDGQPTSRKGSVKAQEAAEEILVEKGAPLASDDIAKIALERDMVTSRAKDPVRSIASTLEKNIRDGVYNEPQLVFVETEQGRQIGLPGMDRNTPAAKPDSNDDKRRLETAIPRELLEKLHLASQAGIADDFESTVALVLRKGLSAMREEVKAGLLEKIEQI